MNCPDYLTPVVFEEKLSVQGLGKELTLYDFIQSYTIELFEVMKQWEQRIGKGSGAPSVPTGQGYFSIDCIQYSLSRFILRAKSNQNQKIGVKKLLTMKLSTLNFCQRYL